MKDISRAALPQCELCAPPSSLPNQREIRYKNSLEQLRQHAGEEKHEV